MAQYQSSLTPLILLLATPALIAKGIFSRGTVPNWSPDGRWRADVVMGHYKDVVMGEKILIWDMMSALTAGTAKAIDTECNFRDDQSGCARRLCEKISPSLDEEQLRKLFGIESYEVMYDRYKSSIDGSLCDHQ